MEQLLTTKAEKIGKALKPIAHLLPEFFIVAGGAFKIGQPINDYDLYPAKGLLLPRFDLEVDEKVTVLCRTANAVTFRHKDIKLPIQCCNFQKPSLGTLVESFDFNSIQVGAMYKNYYKPGSKFDAIKNFEVIDVYYSLGFIEHAVHGEIKYTGAEYPFGSLMRVGKQIARPGVKKRLLIQALGQICRRGFHDYDDFKDQLDAVDLQLLPEDLHGTNDDLMAIYNALSRGPKYSSEDFAELIHKTSDEPGGENG